MKQMITEGLALLADLILPRTCITCGQRLLLHERHLCLKCLMDMPLTYFWQRSHNPMADRFNEVIQKRLEGCTTPPHEYYAYAAALFSYRSEGPYRQIPYQIKYHGNLAVGRHFGRMLGQGLAGSQMFNDVDIVIPVPLHRLRRWKRGYNQAEVIAEEIAAAFGVPLRTDILVRKRRTQTQTQLSIEEKAANVAGAFGVADRAKSLYGVGSYDNSSLPTWPKHILLIDDVFTTGSTLGECFMALRSVFPPEVRISVATLAFVGGT